MPVDRQGEEARSGKRPESVRTGEGETFGERAERLGGEARNHEDWRDAAEEVIARFTSGTLLPSQRRALIALGDALRRSPKGEDHEALPEEKFTRNYFPSKYHEAMENATAAFSDASGWHLYPQIRRGLVAALPYLSRCPSPERDTEKLRDRLVTTTECLRVYLDHRDRGVGIRDGWLEEEVAANDAFLTGFSVLAGESSTTEE